MSSFPEKTSSSTSIATPAQDEKEEMRKEIIQLSRKRGKKPTRLTDRVRKFRDTTVVKRCEKNVKDKYDNQFRAWQLLDPNIVRVPRPIYYFTHQYSQRSWITGFLVMEYITTAKKVKEKDLTDTQLDQVVDIIRYLATFKGTLPGGLMGGQFSGILFDESDPPPESGSVQKLNEWIHTRRTLYPDTTPKTFVDFGEFELVLCHLDVVPRNILWPVDIDGGAPWLIDWETAAYLPRLFQYYHHELSPIDREFHQRILCRLEPLSEREKELKAIFNRARGNTILAYYHVFS